MNSFTVLWEKTLARLEAFYARTNSLTSFNAYIRAIDPEFEDGGVYYLKVPSDIYCQSIRQRFLPKIRETMIEANAELTGAVKDISVEVRTQAEMDALLLEKSTAPANEAPQSTTLNSFYTFDTFVVGESNKVTSAISMRVAETPGLIYNPLFIYGGVGLGKTHLMHAIGNDILRRNPGANILYISSEAFVNEYVESLRKNTPEQFRKRFRTVDVLMIDDIQFVSKKEGTQQELFHTFNALYEANKQVVFSSDKHPSELSDMEDRLVSRFNSGIVTDIGLPDYETRVAILKSKAPYLQNVTKCYLDIDDAVMHFIAEKEDTNIRDLEGALKKVIAQALIYSMERNVERIDLSIAEEALKGFFSKSVSKAITPDVIIGAVCNYYNVTQEDIKGKRKSREISDPRQVAMYLLRTMTNLTYSKIGDELGGKHYSTIMFAEEKISKQIREDKALETAVADITRIIQE